MKLRLKTQILALFFIPTMALTVAPSTGLAQADQNAPLAYPGPRVPQSIDPATGLPITPPEQPWKDENWQDPDKVLADVNYDGLPLSEVARILRDEFKNAFDILIPQSWQDPNASGWHDPNIPVVPLEPGSVSIKMQLKNVTASEAFNAMNIMFEGENTPYRWELRMNGKRPTAILRVLPQLLPPPQYAPPPQRSERMVYFIGDLLGNKASGSSMEQLAKTVSEVQQMSGEGNAVIKFHKEAQLLIVTGSPDDIGFVEQTLAAMRVKARMDEEPRPKPADSGSSGEPAKSR